MAGPLHVFQLSPAQFQTSLSDWFARSNGGEAPSTDGPGRLLEDRLAVLMSLRAPRCAQPGDLPAASSLFVYERGWPVLAAQRARGWPAARGRPAFMEQVGHAVGRSIIEILRVPQGGHDGISGLQIFGSPNRRGQAIGWAAVGPDLPAPEHEAAGPHRGAGLDTRASAQKQAAAGPAAQAAAGHVAASGAQAAAGPDAQAAAGHVASLGAQAAVGWVALLEAQEASTLLGGRAREVAAVGPADGPDAMCKRMREMPATAAQEATEATGGSAAKRPAAALLRRPAAAGPVRRQHAKPAAAGPARGKPAPTTKGLPMGWRTHVPKKQNGRIQGRQGQLCL